MDCLQYNTCDAPLCPKDINPKIVWYPGETICLLRSVPDWVKKQKKIAKVYGLKGDNMDARFDLGYFTVPMLEKVLKIGRGIRGRESDKL